MAGNEDPVGFHGVGIPFRDRKSNGIFSDVTSHLPRKGKEKELKQLKR